MNITNSLSACVAVGRSLGGRRARWVYFALLLALILFSATIRARSFLLTQKIHAVLSGLATLKVDETTEQQLARTVPYLVPEKTTRPDGQRYYHADISNTDDDRWMGLVPEFLYKIDPPRIGPGGVENKWEALSLPLKVAYVLGWRHLSFKAYVVIFNGTVSSTWYGIEPDVFLGAPASYLVVARSVHGFWKRDRAVPVQSTDDESPDYRFGFVAGQFSFFTGADSAIGVAYTPEARPDLVSHVYSVDLRCFWSIRGCDSIRQVTTFLWEDRQAIVTTTEARLHSANPCPDEVLRGRIRTLLDLDIALLEIVKSRSEEDNNEGDRAGVISTRFSTERGD